MVVDEPAGALPAASLLVGRRAEDDVAAKAGDGVRGGIAAGLPGGPRQAAHDLHFHRHHRLHVDGAAAPDVAFRKVAAERVVGPAFRFGWHHVQVREEQQRLAAGAVAAEPRHDRTAAGKRLHDRRLDALVSEDAFEVTSREELVAGRVDGLNPDEGPDQFDQLGEFAIGEFAIGEFRVGPMDLASQLHPPLRPTGSP